MEYTFEFTEGYDEEFHSWDGILGKWMRGRAEGVLYKAQATSPFLTGALRASLGTFYTTSGGELEARIGANPGPVDQGIGYGYFMHEGTQRHWITPRRPGGYLHFYWKKQGHWVRTKRVNHPGTKPIPYLTPWLEEAVQ